MTEEECILCDNRFLTNDRPAPLCDDCMAEEMLRDGTEARWREPMTDEESSDESFSDSYRPRQADYGVTLGYY